MSHLPTIIIKPNAHDPYHLISINRLSMYGEIMTHRVRKLEINYIPFIMIIYFRKIPMICLVSNFGKGIYVRNIFSHRSG